MRYFVNISTQTDEPIIKWLYRNVENEEDWTFIWPYNASYYRVGFNNREDQVKFILMWGENIVSGEWVGN